MEELLVSIVGLGVDTVVDTVVGAVVVMAVRQKKRHKYENILLLRHSKCLKMQQMHSMHMLDDFYDKTINKNC